jgi:hypothetical protein
MRAGGSVNPAVIRVVMPPARAGGIRFGLTVWTWLSTPPGVAIRPYPAIGFVCGPISRSMPSLIPGFPPRPMPAIRPSLMPMSAFRTPSTGSTITAPTTIASSSLGPAVPDWVSPRRMSLA